MKKNTHKRLVAIVFGMTLFAISASAGTANSNMAVSATVAGNCSLSAGSLAFGGYDPVSTNASAALNGTGTLTVNCTSGASATISLDQGLNPATGSTAAAPQRRLSDGSNHFLSYALYSDSGYTNVWGSTGTSYTGTGTSGTVTVYGSVASGQNVPSGTYNDTVVVTITF